MPISNISPTSFINVFQIVTKIWITKSIHPAGLFGECAEKKLSG